MYMRMSVMGTHSAHSVTPRSPHSPSESGVKQQIVLKSALDAVVIFRIVDVHPVHE
jgi:hypothetical protein